MTEHEDRVHSALGAAAVAIGQLEHALATAQTVEVKAERTGAFLLRLAVVVLAVLVVGVTGLLAVRWLLQQPEPEWGVPDDASGTSPVPADIGYPLDQEQTT